MSTIPMVSVIIPAYNAEAFISQTLNSVLSQSYQNFEVLVVDDGSQDHTPEIVRSFAQKDDRVKLFQQKNAGVAAARNLAIEKSRGEYIAPVDADDIWYPENLEKRVQCLSQSEASVGVVYAWSLDIDETSQPMGGFHAATFEGNVYIYLVYRNFLGNASASLIRRVCFDTVGGYNPELRERGAQGCEDRDLYLRIAEHYQFRVVPEFLIGYRKLVSSMSSDYTSMARSHLFVQSEVRQKHPEIPSDIYWFSNSNFFVYLAKQSSLSGDYRSALFWLYKALNQDMGILLRHHVYTLSVESLCKLLTRPIAALIWSDHLAWVQFRQKLKANSPSPAIDSIYKRMALHRWLPWKIYERRRLKNYQDTFRTGNFKQRVLVERNAVNS
jgi:glycosyltransferase involved in cell wall biosynthesis